MAERAGAKAGDLVLILCGKKFKTLTQLCALRLEVAQQLGLRDPKKFAPLWVIDFPLFEWDDETQRLLRRCTIRSPRPSSKTYNTWTATPVACGPTPTTSSATAPRSAAARSVSTTRNCRPRCSSCWASRRSKRRSSFGFLMNAFKYGAPPHGGLAFGFDRLCSLFGGSESIRDYIAFPKNNNGRDMMLDAPGYIDQAQLDELHIQLVKPEE